MKTLIIIDMQKGFIKNGTEFLVEKINTLLSQNIFENVIYTKFVNDEACPAFNITHWTGMKNESEQQIVVDIKQGSHVFSKNTHGLSCEIISFLKDQSLNHVYLCGLDTDACVFAAAHQLFDNGIKPLILKNYTTTSSSKKYLADYAIEIMKRSFGEDCIVDEF